MSKEELIKKAKDMNEKSWSGCNIKASKLIDKMEELKKKPIRHYPLYNRAIQDAINLIKEDEAM